jgi:hypothetical protein
VNIHTRCLAKFGSFGYKFKESSFLKFFVIFSNKKVGKILELFCCSIVNSTNFANVSQKIANFSDINKLGKTTLNFCY